MKVFKNQSGFTLLELIISMTMISVIVGIALGGMRLGISARDIGEQKANTYQRLRFIGEQISQKIKSLHPFFIRQNQEKAFFDAQNKTKKPQKYLAFEGLPHSIRIVTFANALSMVKQPPWMHEVRFYLGTHPRTLEKGIIMMERSLALNDVFTEVQPDSPGVRHIMLANEVDHLQFRYLKMRQKTPEELEEQAESSVPYKSEWVDTVIITPDEDTQGLLFNEEETQASKKENKISLPRAMEISIGLNQPTTSSNIKGPEVVYLPPTVILFHSGMEFAPPPVRNEGINEKT